MAFAGNLGVLNRGLACFVSNGSGPETRQELRDAAAEAEDAFDPADHLIR